MPPYGLHHGQKDKAASFGHVAGRAGYEALATAAVVTDKGGRSGGAAVSVRSEFGAHLVDPVLPSDTAQALVRGRLHFTRVDGVVRGVY